MKNQECKVRPEIVDINSNDPIFYPLSIKANKCSGNCNNISDPYARICIPDAVKNLNLKVFNLVTFTKMCKCICRLNKIICNNKQRWSEDKCRCECKELIDKGICNKGYIWNPSSCECECDKSCNIGESNCKCRKKLVDPLIEECTEKIDETKLVKTTLDKNKNRCNFCIVYRVLFCIFFLFFIISIGIGIYFAYRKYANCNKYNLPY